MDIAPRSKYQIAISRRHASLGVLAASTLLDCRSGARAFRGRTSFWYAYGGKNRAVLERLLARFHREQSEVQVDATFQGDYYEALAKLRVAIAVREAPALAHVVAEIVPYLADAGVLEPLDSYEGARALDIIPQLGQANGFVGGADHPLYAIPFNRSVPIMYLNGTMLESKRLVVPVNWEELRSTARELTVRKGSMVETWGVVCPTSWWYWVAMLIGAGGSLIDREGRPTLDGDAGVRAIEFWQQLVHVDQVMRPPIGRDYAGWEDAMGQFLSGRVAILWSSTAFLRYVEENARFDVRVSHIPGDIRQGVPAGGSFFVIMRGAPDAEKRRAWKFLRWMCAAPQANEWATSTGYFPVAMSAVAKLQESGYYSAHPRDEVVLSQISSIEPWPWFPPLFRIQREIMDPLLEDCILQYRNARDALAEAQREALAPG